MRSILLYVLMILFLSADSLFAGAWVQKKGDGYSQLAFNYFKSNSLFSNKQGTITLNRAVTDITIQGYVEYGVSDRVTILGVIPFKLLKNGDEIFASEDFTDTLQAGSINRPGNISIGARYGFLRKKYFVMSAQVRADIKTASYHATTGLRTGYDAWGFAPSLLAGTSYSFKFGLGVFVSVEGGVALRSNNYSHEYFAVAEIGLHYKQRVFAIFVIDMKQSFFDGKHDDENSVFTSTYVNDQEYIAYGYKIIGGITKNFGVSFTYFSAFSANLLPRKAAIGGGVYYKWK